MPSSSSARRAHTGARSLRWRTGDRTRIRHETSTKLATLPHRRQAKLWLRQVASTSRDRLLLALVLLQGLWLQSSKGRARPSFQPQG
jgi:hypothetical protein